MLPEERMMCHNLFWLQLGIFNHLFEQSEANGSSILGTASLVNHGAHFSNK